MIKCTVILAGAALLAASVSPASEVVSNPLTLSFEREPVCLRERAPGSVGTFTVLCDGRAVPYQVEGDKIWVPVTLPPGASVRMEIEADHRSPIFPPAVTVRRAGDIVELDNGAIAVRVGAKGPLLGWRAGEGPWRGWAETPAAMRETIEVESGPVFAQATVVSLYENGGERRFSVRLLPGRPYATVTETHRNAPDFAFCLTADWPAAQRAVIRRWYKGPFQAAPDVEELDLDPAATRVPGEILRALPRWTQSCEEGWFVGVSDGAELVAALPIRAGRWVWPHDNALVLTMDDRRRALLRAEALRGARHWLLVAGARTLANEALDIATRAAFVPLDKLHNEYILSSLDAPAGPARPIRPANFYSNQTNPTDIVRRLARQEAERIGQPTRSMEDLYDAQARLDSDWYGCYENFWSPINPNFYTDFIQYAVLKIARLREHPQFDILRGKAVAALQADLRHSVTLPGGAGQECPGYQHHTASQWARLAPVAGRYLGFDMVADPRWQATGYFLAHSSVPSGGGQRRFHPAGDTHPDKPDPISAAEVFGYRAHPRSWRTEELPGFGVVFRHRSGENDETFLSFKSGPNRGHYHGDGLSFHLAFDAKDAAPDHRVSYLERPGQEHMHNRVAFRTPRFAFANMDGFERLIAFRTSERADIAVGQVESPRLREVKPRPPEEWDQAYPQQRLARPIVYRRTILFLPRSVSLPRDCFILRDQYWADPADEIEGLFCLHVKGRPPRAEGRVYRFGTLTLVNASPVPAAFDPLDWTPQRDSLRREATRGLRMTVSARDGHGDLITVLYPGDTPPSIEPLGDGLRIGGIEVRFRAESPHAPATAEVREDGRVVLALAEADTDFDRSQGEIGLFVPSAGYPFGPLPDWLIQQRAPLSRGVMPKTPFVVLPEAAP